MEEKLKALQEIISGSKEYRFNGSILTIKGYYTGDTIKLDLSCIDEKMLEEIIVEGDEDNE